VCETGDPVTVRAANDDLTVAWMSLIGPDVDLAHATPVGIRLLGAYAEPHRHYHDTRHLTEVLAHVDHLAPAAHDANLVRLAAWFHDVVYDTTRTDNEDASALIALEVLGELGLAAARCDAVARLVRLTATHAPAPGDADGAVLCDADLAVLGSKPARYDEYAEGVRREYAHLPEAVFAAGRADVLRRLVDRDPLFRTASAQLSWEARARANMGRELERLSQAPLRVPGLPGAAPRCLPGMGAAGATPRRAGG
jgi:predicted metal-dependent HD superfamily phosphohydrolase